MSKQIYEYRNGDKIAGVYYGESFTGKVTENSEVNRLQTHFLIDLDNPITLFRIKRDKISITVNTKTGMGSIIGETITTIS
ncbi:MAG: hypothetical protein PHS34_09770 [Candidatus Omnitrophica bacterium]|nr:hypothetical protein [Candidatus Omnitrophota bacterium]